MYTVLKLENILVPEDLYILFGKAQLALYSLLDVALKPHHTGGI